MLLSGGAYAGRGRTDLQQGQEDVDDAVSAAKTAFQTWGFTKKEERIKLLEKLMD